MIDALGERRLGLCKIDCCIGRAVEDDIRLMALQSTYQRTGVCDVALRAAKGRHLPMG